MNVILFLAVNEQESYIGVQPWSDEEMVKIREARDALLGMCEHVDSITLKAEFKVYQTFEADDGTLLLEDQDLSIMDDRVLPEQMPEESRTDYRRIVVTRTHAYFEFMLRHDSYNYGSFDALDIRRL